MDANAQQPNFRLVGADEPSQRIAWARGVTDAVTAENQSASANRGLDPTDPRWVLAARTHSQLDGATLAPEARQRLLRTASVMGLGVFDANLIIATVQDCARRGEPIQAGLVTFIGARPPSRRGRAHWARWAWAIAAAAVATLLLVRWLTAGQ